MDWIDTTSGATLKTWNGSTWVVGAATRYVALLTASPYTSGPSSGYAQAITDLVEVTTAGYSRQAATFANASAAYPAPVSNSAVLTFGPVSAAMALAAQWAALVTHAATGYVRAAAVLLAARHAPAGVGQPVDPDPHRRASIE